MVEPLKTPPKNFLRRIIRVNKEDSAFVYFILESHEGIVSYSTLDPQAGDAHRDLELRVPPDFQKEVDDLLRELGDLVYEIGTEEARR